MLHRIRRLLLRRRILIPVALAALAGGSAALLLAQEPKPAPAPPPASAAPLTEMHVVGRVTAAVDRALVYLEDKQVKKGAQAGGWHTNHAVNALALLSFMGRGHVPGRGPYRDVLERGKQYLLRTQRADGYTSFGTMYEHGLATLALVEMYGTDPDPELEEKTRKAVDLILKCQAPQGGWNYGPSPQNGDLSVSVMQIVAMRAANNAEIPVPAEQIERAVKYLHDHAHPQGGYGYQGPAQGPQTSAAGALSMALLGHPDDPNIPRTLDYLAAFRPSDTKWAGYGVQYFYYFHYYAMQAHYQAGGKHWNEWHPAVRELLLANQNKDGSWDVPPGTAEAEGTVGPNKVYWTALASLILEIYMHFLPAYQR
jgi:hypothetical protein